MPAKRKMPSISKALREEAYGWKSYAAKQSETTDNTSQCQTLPQHSFPVIEWNGFFPTTCLHEGVI